MVQVVKLGVGGRIAERQLVSITGEPVRLPDPEHLVHLQFRRHAGCPYCNLHLRSVTARHGEIQAAGVREVVFFHSSAEDLLAYNEPMPFAVIADPAKSVYREFGVESAPRALLHPGAWIPVIRGVLSKRRPFSIDHRSGHLGLPADFLIEPDGRVLARKYGTHAFDQWSVDEMLAHAGRQPS
jgi:peroxiredoxin